MRDTESGTDPDRSPSVTVRTLLLVVLVALPLAASGAAAGQPTAASSGAAEVAVDDADAAAQAENGGQNVSLSVERVRNCGDRCRNVTANLTNNGTEELENVSAVTRIYAGDTQLWTRVHRFDTLSVNESAYRSANIRLGIGDALRVARNDGLIRIETTVLWDGGNATFTERRRVLR